MKILALITARGGSSRLPGKNIRLLGGRPLLAWTVDGLRASGIGCPVLLSTDDQSIAEVGRRLDVMVPWIRPPALASDTATSVDVALHALEWFEGEHGSVDALMLLQPTSPFRRPETMRLGMALFRASSGRPVVAMSPVRHGHPLWTYRMHDGSAVPFIPRSGPEKRSQDLPQALHVNGCLYIARPSQIRDQRTFIGDRPVPLVVTDPVEAIDIDDEFDFRVAETMVQHVP